MRCLQGRTEKEMTTHSSTLALRIPWTEEPGMQSCGMNLQLSLKRSSCYEVTHLKSRRSLAFGISSWLLLNCNSRWLFPPEEPAGTLNSRCLQHPTLSPSPLWKNHHHLPVLLTYTLLPTHSSHSFKHPAQLCSFCLYQPFPSIFHTMRLLPWFMGSPPPPALQWLAEVPRALDSFLSSPYSMVWVEIC